MPDGWEIIYELNPLTADGEADLDDDGLPNFREFRASTDPHNKDSDGDIFPDGYEVETVAMLPMLEALNSCNG